MVYKRSEYGRQFKISSLVKNVPVYKEHLNYRHLRRELECAHTPISWEGDIVESSESDDKVSIDEEVKNLPVAELVICEEEEGKDEEEKPGEPVEQSEDEDDIAKEKHTAQAKDAEKLQRETDADVEILLQNDNLRKSAKEKLNKYVSKVNKDEPSVAKDAAEKKVLCKTYVKPKVADDKLFVKRSKPRRPDRQNKVPQARPESAKVSCPLSQGVESTHPFWNYGCGSRERNTGDKKTFNVRASSAVYPAALRAKKRNLQQMERLEERQRSASAREKRKKAKFNERMARETAFWVSEYRRSYPAYENTEYATSDRDPRKKKSPFAS